MSARGDPRSHRRARPLYSGLRVRNLERSIRFYKALGFRQTIRARTSLGEFAQLEHPVRHFTIELNWFRPGSWRYERYKRGSELDHLGFWVDDVDAWTRKLRQAGGRVQLPPYDTEIVLPPRPVFEGRAAYVADPDGIWIELMGPKRARPRASGERRLTGAGPPSAPSHFKGRVSRPSRSSR